MSLSRSYYYSIFWLLLQSLLHLWFLRLVERLDEVVPECLELVEPHARDDVLPHHARRHELTAVLHRRQAERSDFTIQGILLVR